MQFFTNLWSLLTDREGVMASLAGVNAKIAELDAALAAHKAADAAAIQNLQDQIDLLTTQLAAGVTDEQIQEVIDALTAIQNQL